MKINVKPVIRSKKTKRVKPSLSFRNLTPPQHLAPDGTITSTRSQEAKCSASDPWVQRIHDLEDQIQDLEIQIHNLKAKLGSF